jgi:hypothetical protein
VGDPVPDRSPAVYESMGMVVQTRQPRVPWKLVATRMLAWRASPVKCGIQKRDGDHQQPQRENEPAVPEHGGIVGGPDLFRQTLLGEPQAFEPLRPPALLAARIAAVVHRAHDVKLGS